MLAQRMHTYLDTMYGDAYDPIIQASFLKNKLDQMRMPLPKQKTTFGFSTKDATTCGRAVAFQHYQWTSEPLTPDSYQKRWMRNHIAIREAFQHDLWQAQKWVPHGEFRLVFHPKGDPFWGRNSLMVQTYADFDLYGTCDAMVKHVPSGEQLGVLFQTKATGLGEVSPKKMQHPMSVHRARCVANAILFGISEFFVIYESTTKDKWGKAADAKSDFRVFQVSVTQEDQDELTARLQKLAEDLKRQVLPAPEFDKCTFCTYQMSCQKAGI